MAPALQDADMDTLTAAVNRLGLGLDQLPRNQREAGAVLFAKGLCRGVNMCRDGQSAHYLNQMYNILRQWNQEFPPQPTGNMPDRANQPRC